MRLKKLELLGFKSFANPTEIHFDQGVTCVVGPNGCGKSNISDAIRWVLGERSAKLLRGSKMEDVIFNGTDFRKPLSYAEVSLTIDNQDRGLPIDYQEVTLTRRLYRSGESEYLINKTVVRLKDLQDLILDTGIGSSSYSMIEQGKIDYILNANPDERRFLIEEAAGISKYKVKKEEAIRKLERTEENLLRLNDIVQEVHRNIQYAERQAKRAERYKEKFGYLKNLEIRKAFYDVNMLARDRAMLEQVRSKKQVQLDALTSEQSEHNKALFSQGEHLNQAQERYAVEEAERYRVLSQIEKNEQQLGFNQEKRVSFATRRGEIKQEQGQLAERLEKGVHELSVKQETLGRLEEESKGLLSVLSDCENDLREAEDRLGKVKALFEKGKLEALEIAAETTKAKNEYHRMSAFIETSDKQKSKMGGNLDRFTTERHDWESKRNHFESEIEKLVQRAAVLEEDATELRASMERLRSEVDGSVDERERTERLLQEKSTRLKMLREFESSSGGYNLALFQDLPENERLLIHHLHDLIQAEPGYEQALAAVLGMFIHSLVVDQRALAGLLLKALLKKSLGEMSLLVLSSSAEASGAPVSVRPEHPAVRCALKDVVRIRAGYKDLLIPFIESAYVVDFEFTDSQENSDTFESLLDLAERNRLVNCGGLVLGPHGRIYYRQGTALERNAFQRAEEIEKLENEIRGLSTISHDQGNRIAEQKQHLTDLEAKRLDVQNAQIECKIQKESFESMREGLEDRLKSYHRESQLVMADILELDSQRTEAQERQQRLEKELEGHTQKERAHREFESEILQQIREMDEVRNRVLGVVAERRARTKHLEEQILVLQEAVNLIRDSEKQNHERVENLKDEADRMIEREREIEEEDVRLQGEQGQLGEMLRHFDLALALIKEEKNRLTIEMRQSEGNLRSLSGNQREVEEGLHQLEMKLMDLGYQGKLVFERMEQAYQIKMSELDAEAYPWENRDPKIVEAEILEHREKMQSMGPVNLLAIDEFDEMKHRYDFLMSQKQDLEKARESLFEAIRQINRTTKSLFETTFVNVQEKFKEYYQTLFRGGMAQLVLVDDTHPLESGIDIVVRPPGKRLQHIGLLSGGEKALTAVALLFALFKIKPSPFCVLDEIDAPLDEANIDRFLTVLRTFLETSQFIIVTHNRKTIAMGDSLYGVTMEEPGVSKIVSVKVGSEESETFVEPEVTQETSVENSIVA